MSALLFALICAVLDTPSAASTSPAAASTRAPATRQVGQLVLSGVPEWPAELSARMQQYLNARGAGLQDVRDDGGAVLITTRFADTSQLHVVSQPLGMRRQLTFGTEPIDGGFFVPGTGGTRLIFAQGQSGDERTQFYLFDLTTGRTRRLTDPNGRHSSATISRDGRLLALAGTERNGKDYDIYLLDLTKDEPARRLWEVSGNFAPTDFSPDGTRLLVQQFISASESSLHVLDVATGEHQRVSPETPVAYYGGAAWGSTGEALYCVSDRDGEFRKLYRLDVNNGQWRCLTTDIPWDVSSFAVDPESYGVAFVTNEDGLSRLYFAGVEGDGRKALTLPTGLVDALTFARTGHTLGLTLNTTRSPSDVYLTKFPDGPLVRWTESETGGLDPNTFVEPALVRYPTFDQVDGQPRMIPAFYYKAPGAGPHPVVIYAHGGPEGQFTPGFTSMFQYWLVEQGISVIAPNIRGSTGYGRAFHQLDNGLKREDSIKDIGALLDWIGQQPELDAQRVGIFGGSYGGYVVLASLTMYPQRFKAGVCAVGIANFITFLKNTGEYRQDLRRAEYGDERDPNVQAFLERISPLTNADKITAALFVLHGKNDPRVPVAEAEQIVSKLRSLGRPVWYVLGLNEGHGFAHKENNDVARVLYALFWQEQLLK
jgi:dipeptidyl aminopeptidase/acylaminoacyl peptidase